MMTDRYERIRDAQPAVSGYTCTVPDDCETLHWRGQILSMNELASVAQPAVGEEIMVNAAHGVYTLPLQPSGLSSGPRFVVHVPGPEAQAAEARGVVDEGSRTINIDDIVIDDIVAWADGVQGALGTEYADRVTEREAAASRAVLAAIAACPHGVRRPHECKECADTVPASEALEWAEREFAAARQPPGEPGPEAQPAEQHPDDAAVDRFAAAMKEKLAKKREQGRGGWEDKEQCSAGYLSQLLIEHVAKGDPIDVANFAMMLHQRGERISGRDEALPAANADALDAARYRWLRDANINTLPYDDHGIGPEFPCGDDLDAAIDAAMSKEGKQ